tara:strand:- start:176 stop:448 length:273 start_codon:yes stop_codon:yes gene_type:complete
MKYIVGASIGGLFGLSVPFMMDAKETLLIEHDNSPREEIPQHVEESIPIPIEGALILPDNACGYINYDSEDLKEQAKECLSINIYAIPAI